MIVHRFAVRSDYRLLILRSIEFADPLLLSQRATMSCRRSSALSCGVCARGSRRYLLPKSTLREATLSVLLLPRGGRPDGRADLRQRLRPVHRLRGQQRVANSLPRRQVGDLVESPSVEDK